jgi:tetratricopeptide (TPR) repeat protein
LKVKPRFPASRRVLIVAALSCAPACATTSPPVARPAPPVVVEAPPPPPPPPKEKAAREVFAEAIAAFDTGDYDAAEKGFHKVLEKAPAYVDARFNLGLLAERQGRLADAQAAYEMVRALQPGHVPTLLNLGRLYRLQEQYAEAISLYEEALQAPEHAHEVSLLNNLIVSYRLAGRHAQAEATARRLLSRHPDNAEAYKNLSLVYYDQGRYRLAELVLANAHKLDADDPGIYNNLGMIALKLEDRARALAWFQKAVSLDERFTPGYLNLGALALAWRDYAGAERAFARAAELEPHSHEVWLYYAYALDGQKGREPHKGLAAGEAFEKVLALRADHPEALCGAGWAYAVERDGWDKAITFLQRCKVLDTTSPQARQSIDAKLQGIEAMRQSRQLQPAAPREDSEAE